MPRHYFDWYSEASPADRAVPDIVIAFSMAHELAATFIEFVANELSKALHADILARPGV